MGRKLKIAIRGVASFLLVPAFAIFIVLSAVSLHVNGNTYKDILREVAFQQYQQQLDSGQINSDVNDIYLSLAPACQSQESVNLGIIDAQVDCDEILEAGPEGFEEVFKDILGETYEREIETRLASGDVSFIPGVNVDSFDSLFRLLKNAQILLGIASVLFMGIVLFLTKPMYKALIHLGLVGVGTGSPVLVLRSIWPDYDYNGIQALVVMQDNIFNSLFSYFLTVFLAGAVLFVIGFVWLVIHRYKHKATGNINGEKQEIE